LEYLRGGNGGRLYGPTASGREYLCSGRHRNWRHPHKSTWLQSVTEQQESDFYEEAETQGWQADDEHWWTSRDCSVDLGTAGQRLAFFPKPTNATDPSHGYPVTTYRSRDYKVPEDVISRWEEGDRPLVSVRVAKKLRLQQI
jgi:hypothetical protein